jgi:hypothetical protein
MAQDGPPKQTASQTAAEQELRRRAALAEELAKAQPQPGPPPAQRAKRGTVWKVAVAAVVAVAVGYGALHGLHGGDTVVSEAQKQEWATAWAAAGPQVAKAVPKADVQAALDAMHLSAPQRQQMQQQIDDGSTRLVYMTFRDAEYEDLDRVRLDTGDYSTEITILNAPQKVYFPEPAGGVVNVTGTYDGGGGITVAITTGDTPVNMPYMVTGQSVGIPVVVEQ